MKWFDRLPTHWEVRRLRNVADLRVSSVDKHKREDEEHVRLCNYVDVYNNDRITATMNFMHTTAAPDEIERFRLERGDVLITKDSETWDDIGIPALVTESAPDLISGYHLALLRPRSEHTVGGYLFRALESNGISRQFHVQARGVTRFGLTHVGIKSVWLPVPPLSEQVRIVRFLDHADRRIRHYIGAKQKLITLLEEQKQVLIHEAVTGRIDVRTGRPYPAYKESGVEWLGTVPAHWQVRAAKWYFRESDDRSETGSEELLSVSHITGVTPRSDKKNVTMFKAESNVGYKLCAPGDIVVNTMWAWMAALGIVRQTGIVSPSYAVYRPHVSSMLNGEYADLLLRTTAYQNEYVCRSTGIRSSRLRLYPEDFLRIGLLCPPSEEQRSIVAFVDRASDVTIRHIHHTYDEVVRLEEYRDRLIADVVTGKLDVREAVAGLTKPDSLGAEDDAADSVDHDADRSETTRS